MTDDRASPRLPLLALFLLVLGSCGVAAGWILFAYATDRQLSYAAVLAAIDAAWLLRLGRMRAGWVRAVCAVSGTAFTIALANWGIAAAQLSKPLGLLPWDAIPRMGSHHAWTLITLANGTSDLAWLAAGLVIAAITAR